MDEREYFDKQMESIKNEFNKEFKEKQIKKYGKSEWMDKAYAKEFSRLQPIIEAIDNSPNHNITINGYKCLKNDLGDYEIGIDQDGGNSHITICIEDDTNEIRYNGANFIRPLGSIRTSADVNDRHFYTIGNSEITAEHSQRTILENANYFHYNDVNMDQKRQLDLQSQLLMLKSLGIELTPDEESQILGITKEEINKKVAEIKQKESQEREQTRSKETRRWKMDSSCF